MSKIDITYIGPKKFKKDTVTGSRLVFPQYKPVPVEADIAHRLLEYPAVFVQSEDAKAIVEKQKEKLIAESEKQAELEAQAKKDAVSSNMLVILGEEIVDLEKWQSNKLATLIEAEELEVSSPKSPITPYRTEIRDLLREKHGTPELEQE